MQRGAALDCVFEFSNHYKSLKDKRPHIQSQQTSAAREMMKEKKTITLKYNEK